MKKLINDYVKDLIDCPLFIGIKEEDLKAMLRCIGAYVKEYKKNEYIFLCNDNIDSVGIIMSGKVQMIQEDMWGNKAILLNMTQKELFGETFTCGNNLNATVSFMAVEESIIIFLPFEKVMHYCSLDCIFHHRMIENMVTLIANKNTLIMDKINVMSKKTLREKIAAYLTLQAERNNSVYFDIDLGRMQLAEYLNADRSALTRELNAMAHDGFIDFNKNSFHILKELI